MVTRLPRKQTRRVSSPNLVRWSGCWVMERVRDASTRMVVPVSRSSVLSYPPVKDLKPILPTRCSACTVQNCCICSQPTVNTAQVTPSRELILRRLRWVWQPCWRLRSPARKVVRRGPRTMRFPWRRLRRGMKALVDATQFLRSETRRWRSIMLVSFSSPRPQLVVGFGVGAGEGPLAKGKKFITDGEIAGSQADFCALSAWQGLSSNCFWESCRIIKLCTVNGWSVWLIFLLARVLLSTLTDFVLKWRSDTCTRLQVSFWWQEEGETRRCERACDALEKRLSRIVLRQEGRSCLSDGGWVRCDHPGERVKGTGQEWPLFPTSVRAKIKGWVGSVLRRSEHCLHEGRHGGWRCEHCISGQRPSTATVARTNEETECSGSEFESVGVVDSLNNFISAISALVDAAVLQCRVGAGSEQAWQRVPAPAAAAHASLSSDTAGVLAHTQLDEPSHAEPNAALGDPARLLGQGGVQYSLGRGEGRSSSESLQAEAPPRWQGEERTQLACVFFLVLFSCLFKFFFVFLSCSVIFSQWNRKNQWDKGRKDLSL